jgi:hypothetical protein
VKESIGDYEFGAVGLDEVATSNVLLQFQSRDCSCDSGGLGDGTSEKGLSV